MKLSSEKINFFSRIILPTLIAFSLFTITIFVIIIPRVQENLLDKKRELIKELTQSAWSILENLNEEVIKGNISLQEAQEESIEIIEHLRYGIDRKDYFWITDYHPNMLIHPYRKDLNNTDLSDYKDPHGKKLFVDFVKVVNEKDEGFVDYMWQWMDDSTQIVQKLSFVKGFEPWGWIIGTGIYVEDVKEEIALLTNNLMYISFGILVVLAFILTYISISSLRIEKLRQKIYYALKDSEARYKLLVEASTEGLVLFLDSQFVFANQTLYKMLGYSEDEKNLEKILCDSKTNMTSGGEYFRKLKNGESVSNKFDAQLRKKDGSLLNVILYSSDIVLNNRKGYSIILRDVTYNQETEIDSSELKKDITDLLNENSIGLFKTSLGRYGKFISANNAVLKILGYDARKELFEKNLFDFFADNIERKELFQKLNDEKKIKNYITKISKKDGAVIFISITAQIIDDDSGKPIYCNGVIEDIDSKIKEETERENLILDLQNSLKMLNEPIKKVSQKIISCNMDFSIEDVANIMTEQESGAIILKTKNSEFVGIVTDRDIVERGIIGNHNLSAPAHSIMTSPIISISQNESILDAIFLMQKKNIKHLLLKDLSGEFIGMISLKNLLDEINNSLNLLLLDIENATSLAKLYEIKNKIPRFIKSQIDSGTNVENLSRYLSKIFILVASKSINFAQEELGEPPARFVFVGLGSIGREELVITSDQDNAIIFEDVNSEIYPDVKKYFDKLAQIVCNALNECGYEFCPGDVMSKNTKWTQSITTWKEYFYSWIVNSNPQDLLDISIFFDFSAIYGSGELLDDLRGYIFKIAENQANIYQHLTRTCLQRKIPVGFLGKIVLESKGEHPETFDIKNAIMVIVDFARLYSLKNKSKFTNTLERLEELNRLGIVNKSSYNELVQAYKIMTEFRFKHHSKKIRSCERINNFINPNELTEIEQSLLKNIFSHLLALQKKLNYDFSGEAL
ncbi:MAG: cache domain-containing protein [Ignavibacteriales bacterium]|nr:cache domain-containing protein [Ignavibacteriales bacterium]